MQAVRQQVLAHVNIKPKGGRKSAFLSVFNGESMTTNRNYAAPMLVVGCVLFGLGSLIVKFVPVGGYAIAFWRLLIASFVFYGLMKWKKQTFPKNRKA